MVLLSENSSRWSFAFPIVLVTIVAWWLGLSETPTELARVPTFQININLSES